MNYTDVKNPQWANAEHTALKCDVDFDDLREEYVPFTAVASGDYDHSHQIFAECVAGNYGVIAKYVEPLPYVPTIDYNKQIAVKLLQFTDWTTIADVGNPQMANPYLANQAEFIAYRNAVRQHAITPIAGNIEWAVLPKEVWQTV